VRNGRRCRGANPGLKMYDLELLSVRSEAMKGNRRKASLKPDRSHSCSQAMEMAALLYLQFTQSF
jgi:hypothetical protein